MLDDLLERVRAATGPDRELDALIQQALFPETQVLFDAGDVRTKRPGRFGKLADFPLDAAWNDWDAIALTIGAKPYTASLDAALALAMRLAPNEALGLLDDAVGALSMMEPPPQDDLAGRLARALIATLLAALNQTETETKP